MNHTRVFYHFFNHWILKVEDSKSQEKKNDQEMNHLPTLKNSDYWYVTLISESLIKYIYGVFDRNLTEFLANVHV